MKESELKRVMKSRVAGIRGDDLRDAIYSVFRDRTDLIPEPARKVIENLSEEQSGVLLTIVDIAALAAQCKVRKIHGMQEPLNL